MRHDPAETVYILKKSVRKEKPAKRPPQLVLPPSDDDEEINIRMIDTLSIYKRSPKPLKLPVPAPDTLTPLLPLEHTEGVFTPYQELSDGDITEDSGTGNSLDSEEGKRSHKSEQKEINSARESAYHHKSRIPVREQLQMNKLTKVKPTVKLPTKPARKPFKTKLPQPEPITKEPKHQPKLNRPAIKPVDVTGYNAVKPVGQTKKLPFLPASPPVITLSPSVVGDRHTLLMQKLAQPRKFIAKPTKPPKPTAKPVPALDLHRRKVVVKKPSISTKSFSKNPHKLKQISPRKTTMPIQILESASDGDDANEIFRQRPVVMPVAQKPKPTNTRNLPPVRNKRNNGIRPLGRVY